MAICLVCCTHMLIRTSSVIGLLKGAAAGLTQKGRGTRQVITKGHPLIAVIQQLIKEKEVRL